jgi:uncharacterized repeat protein (TIGR03809 family)
MSEPQSGRYDSIARRWLALVERRQEHFIELSNTGRWRHYYTQTEFLDEMRKVLRVRDQWATIAGVPPSDDAGAPNAEVVSLDEERQSRRERGPRQHAAAGSSAVPVTSWSD